MRQNDENIIIRQYDVNRGFNMMGLELFGQGYTITPGLDFLNKIKNFFFAILIK